jgi:uncharacterized membrane protein YdbT with pleckstrin-like domain
VLPCPLSALQGFTYYTYGLPDVQQQQQHDNRAEQQQQQQQQQQQAGSKDQRHKHEQRTPPGKKQQPAGRTVSSSSNDRTTASAGPGAARVPLLVLHGVGAGLLPYLGVVLSLAAAGQPMVLPVWKQVSMRLMRVSVCLVCLFFCLLFDRT